MAFCVGVERLGRGPLKIAAGLGAFMVMYAAITPAEANSKRKKAPSYSPPYASIVVDANTGKVLFGENENALRRFKNLTVVALPGDAMDAACALLQRGMRLTAMIQDGELQLMSESENVTMRPVWLQKPE